MDKTYFLIIVLLNFKYCPYVQEKWIIHPKELSCELKQILVNQS